MSEQLECTTLNIRFRNEQNGFTVLDVRAGDDETSVVGVLPFVSEGERVRFTGRWGEHADFGRQFNADYYEVILPTTRMEIERYLALSGIKGIGPATARDIVRAFGEETLNVLDWSPERLYEVPRLGKKRAALIIESYQKAAGERHAIMFLQRYDISPLMCMRIIKKYGKGAQSVINENPYRMIEDIEGMGFKTCDGIARRVGLDPASPYRLSAGIRYALVEAAQQNGHVFLPCEQLISTASSLLEAEPELIRQTLLGLVLTKALARQSIAGEDAVYLPAYHAAECDVALGLTQAMRAARVRPVGDIVRHIETFESETGLRLHEEQRKAIVLALTRGVVCLTGGPGTGKTTIIRCILSVFTSLKLEVLLCAPTGRAAKRMSEATGREAMTVHRMLEYTGSSFERDGDNPLEAEAIIVDELSMMDILLMRSLLRALPDGARVVLVGDADQLPSVGPGSVIADLLTSGVVPSVRLTEIFRQAQESLIVHNAHRINRGERLAKPNREGDFFFERAFNATAAAELITDLCARRLPGFKNLKPGDIQVLAPMRKGEAGVSGLNQRLQAALNPPAPLKVERRMAFGVFREGDRVMQVHNNYALDWESEEDEGQGVFNGEMGVIESIDNEADELAVLFDGERRVIYDSTEAGDLELAYAVTIHKSQGSEFPCVIIPILNGPPMLMTRNLLYTGVTRARSLAVLVGREDAVDFMIENNAERKRFGALAERLRMMDVAGQETLEDVEPE